MCPQTTQISSYYYGILTFWRTGTQSKQIWLQWARLHTITFMMLWVLLDITILGRCLTQIDFW